MRIISTDYSCSACEEHGQRSRLTTETEAEVNFRCPHCGQTYNLLELLQVYTERRDALYERYWSCQNRIRELQDLRCPHLAAERTPTHEQFGERLEVNIKRDLREMGKTWTSVMIFQ